MEYRQLGQHGLEVSELSLGFWVTYGGQVGEDVAVECMKAAFDAGVNFFDNADAYAKGNAEIVMGNAIRKLGLKRTDLVLSSKAFWPTGDGPNDKGLSRKHLMESVHASLKRIGTDYLDMYFCHRYDPDVPVEEVVRTMDDLVHQGKILYWGTSEWRGGKIGNAMMQAGKWGLYPPAVKQPQYNMFKRDIVETELLEAAGQHGVGLVVWSPLASGILTGKYKDGIPQDSRLAHLDYTLLHKFVSEKRIAQIRLMCNEAAELGVSLAQISMSRLVAMPQGRRHTTGAGLGSQVHQNVKALEAKAKLTPDVLAKIEDILDNDPNKEAV